MGEFCTHSVLTPSFKETTPWVVASEMVCCVDTFGNFGQEDDFFFRVLMCVFVGGCVSVLLYDGRGGGAGRGRGGGSHMEGGGGGIPCVLIRFGGGW